MATVLSDNKSRVERIGDPMKSANQKYAEQVVALIPVDRAYKTRIKEDIISRLEEYHSSASPEDLMGSTYEVAQEFIENIEPSALVNQGKKTFNYTSKAKIMGIPLISIRVGKFEVAKGIIAIGNFSVGVISIGAFSLGIFSLGGIGLGVMAFGGLALGAIGAFGGVAAAYMLAIGGVAVAHNLAIGGVAIATDIAIGDVAHAKLTAYMSDYKGEFGFNRLTDSAQMFTAQLNKSFPNFPKFLKRILDIVYGSTTY